MVVKTEYTDDTPSEQKETNSVETSETEKKDEETEKVSESLTADKKEVCSYDFMFNFMINIIFKN